MASNTRKGSKHAPSESVYHIKQTVNVDASGIKFNFYEVDGLKKVTYSGRKNPDGNYFIFEKIGEKVQTFEGLTEEQFLKKIATIPHLKLVNDQIANKMKKSLKRFSLARTASRKVSKKGSKKGSKKVSKKGSKKAGVRRASANKKPAKRASRKGSRKAGSRKARK